MPATLLVLAAGAGSRFKGNIKQLTPVGPSGQLLMEYSVYDAAAAGFDRAVFVIRRELEEYFRDTLIPKLSGKIKADCCFQELGGLPEGFCCPDDRTKPWGTVQAVLSAGEIIDGSFLIVNADDYYGKTAYRDIYSFLNKKNGGQCMAGFVLKNTLSSKGAVTRGICTVNGGLLSSVTETRGLICQPDGTVTAESGGKRQAVDENSVVSMNMWGCTADVLPVLERYFREFLYRAREDGSLSSAEYLLPAAFDAAIKNRELSFSVLPTRDRWFGMTYAEDRAAVAEALREMTLRGDYPDKLFG